jgi:IstB-like ATP binding protein
LLFELISARYKRRSMLVTANQPFDEWGKVFPDPAMDERREFGFGMVDIFFIYQHPADGKPITAVLRHHRCSVWMARPGFIQVQMHNRR